MLSDVSARQCLSDECLHLLYPFAIKRDSIKLSCIFMVELCLTFGCVHLRAAVTERVCQPNCMCEMLYGGRKKG